MSEELEPLEGGVTLIAPAEGQAMACNLRLETEGRATMVLHRQALLIITDIHGENYVCPLSPTGAAQMARDLQLAASHAASAMDDEDLEEVEISFTKKQGGEDGEVQSAD